MRHEPAVANEGPFRLGEWEVYPQLNRIAGAGGETRQLEPKVMRVLTCLAAHGGEVVGQDELIDAVWGGIAVSPNVLTYSIAALRKALGDDWRAPRYVETISKSGYRLVAPVEHASGVTVATAAGARLPRPQGAGGAASGEDGRAERAGGTAYAARRTPLGLVAMLVATAALLAVARLALQPVEPAPVGLLQPVPLTALPGNEIHPALSPDGNHLAFAWRAAEGQDYDLYVKLIGSEQPALLASTPREDVSPAWTPDGLHVAYVSRGAQGECDIFQIPATGGASRRIADCPGRPIGNMAFSPDGTQLTIGSGVGPGEPTRIFVLTLADGAVAPIGDPPPTAQGDYYPMFSPDGTRLSFHRIRGDGLSDLFVVDLASGESHRVTHDNRDIGGHDWAASGEELLFSSYRTGQFRIWRVPVSGGEATPLAIADHQMTSLSLSRESGRLAYYRSVTDTNLWAAPLPPDSSAPPDSSSPIDSSAPPAPPAPAAAGESNATGAPAWPPREPVPAFSSTRWEAHPQLSPQGDRIAFASDRSGYFEIWSSGLDGIDPIQHTTFAGPFVGTPRYSPDAQQIVFDARPDGHADLWTVAARGSGPERLTSDPGDEFAASYSRDGRWIYFTSNRAQRWEIWRMPAGGGAPTQLTKAGGYAAQEGPDGFLYYTKPGEPGIWRAAIEADGLRTEQQVLSGPVLIDWGSWTVGDRGIYLIVRNPDTIALWELPQGRFIPLLPLGGAAPRQHPSLSVSADGTVAVYAQVDRRETDIMMVEGIR